VSVHRGVVFVAVATFVDARAVVETPSASPTNSPGPSGSNGTASKQDEQMAESMSNMASSYEPCGCRGSRSDDVGGR
jgi:hypothetical protein